MHRYRIVNMGKVVGYYSSMQFDWALDTYDDLVDEGYCPELQMLVRSDWTFVNVSKDADQVQAKWKDGLAW